MNLREEYELLCTAIQKYSNPVKAEMRTRFFIQNTKDVTCYYELPKFMKYNLEALFVLKGREDTQSFFDHDFKPYFEHKDGQYNRDMYDVFKAFVLI